MADDDIKYDFTSIEKKWQDFWEREKTFLAEDQSDKPKYYALDMFPYPSGAGLHIGHPEGYVASDILARYKKALGFNVLHPMGWDAFGLPAEQYAIKTGTHPSQTTQTNVDNFRRQIKSIGFAIDWDREINTTDPGYYQWTQWIFLKLFQRGLAYVDQKPVWWCPNLRAVLANEEIVDGKSEVGGHPVERKNLRQVVLRITAYADKLLAGLEDLDWPDSTKRQQKAWIGRSEGAEVQFAIEGKDEKLVKLSKSTATHSTLVIDDNSSCKFKKNKNDYLLKDSLKILNKNIIFEKNYWKISSSHDGYNRKYNTIHERNIEYYPEQSKFIGTDKILIKKSNSNIKFDIRFHLEPNVKLMKTQDNKAILIQLEEEGWKFTCDNFNIDIDNGLYFGNKNSYIRNQNIFISGITSNKKENISWQLNKV